VLALDAPGFGESPALEPAAYHPHALVDLVPALLAALGLERAAFMGFSWGGDLGCHLAARHRGCLAALVLLDAGYADPPLDPALPYEERVRRSDAARAARVAPSWDAVVARARAECRRWTPAIEAGIRAGWREEGEQVVPAVPGWVVAAVEHGMAQALPSATRPLLAASRLPVLLVAAGDADEEELARFMAAVPQAVVHRAPGTGHDVLVDGGPEVIHLVGRWLETAGSPLSEPESPF
jgi:pimeloyl-ACP methyl ester carboxylesterase